MSTSPIPHVVAYLTRPLAGVFPAARISSAQLILHASLATSSSATTFTLASDCTLPPALLAASVGANVPWSAWYTALGGSTDSAIVLSFGPGYVRARVGDGAVVSVWSEEAQGSIVPISRSVRQHAHSQSPDARCRLSLRSVVLSARVRAHRRQQSIEIEPIRIPSLLFSSDSHSSDSSSDDGDVSDLESDSGASSYTAYSNSNAASPPATPPKPTRVLPTAASPRAARPAKRVSPRTTDLTAYLYKGGVTRVMTGGVMLGPRVLIRSTRS
ncbi:unnamed protein product [Mycena citricolor]|uniref:Uncharacterized protein n=1 Tax=Mycena citricolor TaxID=2018698 RepID=A0AAD2GZV2_9AGAR|nr:unnamed protein product [Mycena citricolor]